MKLGKVLLCGLLFINITSCDQKIYYDSLDDYLTKIKKSGLGYSSLEIDDPKHFLPKFNFIVKFEYMEGKFFYEDFKGVDKAFLLLKYDQKNYSDAKEYSISDLSNLDLTSKNNFVYNDYYFYENMAHPKYYGNGKNGNIDENGDNKFFPTWFTMFCFNDKINTLIFMGYFNVISNEEKNKILNDWEYFLTYYYGQFYDFTK